MGVNIHLENRSPASAAAPGHLGLFAYINDICYFAKNRKRQFTAANKALLQVLSLQRESEVIGKTDHELIAEHLADAYQIDDEQVIKKGISIINKVELVTRNYLSVYWYVTTKIPIRGPNGQIIGLAGMMREFSPASTAIGRYPELYKAIKLVEEKFGEKVAVEDMAQVAGMTVRTFERRFKDCFHIGPISYLKKVRINAACRELIQTNRLLADIAQRCGFCDQSYMTKEFTRIKGITPQAYRGAHTINDLRIKSL
jgi:AraC-like DNA-binding protein